MRARPSPRRAGPEGGARVEGLFWKGIPPSPPMILLFFLLIGAFFVVVFAWFAILITGRFPQSLHGYVAGVIRWGTRVQAYFLSLTHEDPPFSLSGGRRRPHPEA